MRRKRQQRGLSLPEILVSLALMAILLVAVAAAFKASFTSYTENDRIAKVTQTARWVLNRIIKNIRTADAVSCTSTRIDIIPIDDGSGLQLIQYEYADGALVERRTVNGNVSTYTLLDDTTSATLTGFTINATTGVDWEGTPCTTSVTLRAVFDVEGRSLTVPATADPRRNQSY